MAPLSAALRDALGEHVSQSDAARAFGLTPRGVTLKIRRGELRCLRVGRRVLIPREDVEAPRKPNRGGDGRNDGPKPGAALAVLEALADALGGLQVAVAREAKRPTSGALEGALRRSVRRAREAGIEPPPDVEELLLRRGGRRDAPDHDEEDESR